MKNHGIENLKPAFRLVGTTVTAVANIDTNQDGSIQGMEIFNAVQQVVVKAIADRPESLPALKQELMDLDEQEKEELYAIVEREVKMPRPKTEKLTERIIKIIIEAFDLVVDATTPDEAFLPA